MAPLETQTDDEPGWNVRRAAAAEARRPRARPGFPTRNVRRALFLILALLAVISLKRSSGGFFRNVLDSVSPPPPAPAPTQTIVHIKAGPPPATPAAP